MEPNLPLAQKLYFLGIHPEKGGIVYRSHTAMDYVILGGLLMELYLNKNIRFEEKKIIVLSTKSDHQLHEYLLEKMSKAKSPRRISRWINKFYYSLNHIRNEVRQGLVDERMIKMDPKRFLFFKWKKPVVLNKLALYKIIDQVKSDITNGTSSEEELIMLSFIEPAGLLYRLFPEKKQRKLARRRLKEMMVSNRVSKAVADAITASQAVAASVAATAATASATT